MGSDGHTILGLDVGDTRIGMAIAHDIARIPQPVGALDHTSEVFDHLRELCVREDVGHIVIGLPRGLDGQDTQQTNHIREFGARLGKELDVPYSWQDEAVTSVQAEAELRARRKPYTKQDVDALAATYILGDYLHAI